MQAKVDPDRDDADIIATPAAQTSAPPTRTVLYVEDNPSNMQLMRKLFARRRDIRPVYAHTPLLGIEMALAEKPDLVLLDINLPGMNGREVLARLRSHPETAAVPIVAVTANAMPGDVAQGIAAGFDAYVTKPIDISAFMQAIDRWLALGASM
ncbi:MAG TPA: response regulator [Gammaproteobacteria bacterium]|nr:response regulator [Gammaproteobacteria bacterium]